MRRSPAARAATAVGIVVMLAGCTTNEAGSATPDSTAGTPPTTESQETSASSAPTSDDIPPPPRQIGLDGIDPCALFTEAQQAELKITDVSPGVGETSIYKDMKECTLEADAAEPFISYNVVAVTNVDVRRWLNEPSNADVKLITIAGFPAAEFSIKGGAAVDCAVAVGVADNQHLHVKMAPLSDGFSGDQMCQGSRQAAEMALQTLQTLR